MQLVSGYQELLHGEQTSYLLTSAALRRHSDAHTKARQFVMTRNGSGSLAVAGSTRTQVRLRVTVRSNKRKKENSTTNRGSPLLVCRSALVNIYFIKLLRLHLPPQKAIVNGAARQTFHAGAQSGPARTKAACRPWNARL